MAKKSRKSKGQKNGKSNSPPEQSEISSERIEKHEPLSANPTNANHSSDAHPETTTTKKTYENLDKQFLTNEDGLALQDVIRDHYKGFAHLPVEQLLPSNFHESSKSALERLRDADYYQYDIVMAGGKHTSRTFVKRTLVGDPGITYKYLGLRLFAHAWSGPGVLPVMKAIGDMNQHMIRMTRQFDDHGLCDYNLTLINYMEPSSHTKIGFKDEAFYGMGKVSVSWHADSSLESNSSIGVYHCLPTQRASKWDWRVALRRNPDASEKTANGEAIPPIAVDTKDGDAYFMLGKFNETHQHCVLSGSEANRISSTHRVAVSEKDTYEYIRKNAKLAIKRLSMQLELDDTSKMNPKVIVFCQRVLTEMEMDWIAQYWLQGAEHDKMHLWWQQPMRALESLWNTLEELTYQLFRLCVEKSDLVPRLLVKGFLLELEKRQVQREAWDVRRADKIYQRRIRPEYRPVARPIFDTTKSKRLGKDLSSAMDALNKLREANKKPTKIGSEKPGTQLYSGEGGKKALGKPSQKKRNGEGQPNPKSAKKQRKVHS